MLFVVACSTAQDDKVIEDGGSEPAVALSDGLGGVIDDGDDTQGLTPDPRRGGSDTWTTGPELGPPAGPPESCIVLTPQGADPSDALFAKDCVLDVQVQLAPADWETLRHQSRAFVDIVRGECHAQVYPEVFDWFQADVVVAGQTLMNVGIRKKGFFGSLSAEKPSLKIRFDKYSEGQRLAGLDRMTLNNLNSNS